MIFTSSLSIGSTHRHRARTRRNSGSDPKRYWFHQGVERVKAEHRHTGGQVLGGRAAISASSSEQNSIEPATWNAILSSSPRSSQRLPHFSHTSYDNFALL